MEDGQGWEWVGLGEADDRPLDMVGTCAALLRMRMRGGHSGSEEADLAWVLWLQALVFRLHRGLDEAEALGLPVHLTQSALIWRWIGRERGIALRLDLDRSVVVPAGSATPLARIVHQVVTNCFEHAFSDDRGGGICLRLARDGDAVAAITIQADGPEPGRSSRPGARPHLDAGIVTRLAAEVGADFSSPPTPGGGTTVRLRFTSPL